MKNIIETLLRLILLNTTQCFGVISNQLDALSSFDNRKSKNDNNHKMKMKESYFYYLSLTK